MLKQLKQGLLAQNVLACLYIIIIELCVTLSIVSVYTELQITQCLEVGRIKLTELKSLLMSAQL